MSWMLTDPKFRPEEVAEILGVDRKTVIKLTDKRLIGYFQVGPRTRRIGLRHLRKYFARIQDEAERIGKERKAKLPKARRKTLVLFRKPGLAETTLHNLAARNCEEGCSGAS